MSRERSRSPGSVLEFDRRDTYLAQFRTVSISSRPSTPEEPPDRPDVSNMIADYRDRAQQPRRSTRSSSTTTRATRMPSERQSATRSNSSRPARPERQHRPHLDDCRAFSSPSASGHSSMMDHAVRDLLNREIPELPSRSKKRYSEQETYVPSPKITFLIDQPKLTCQICQATTLKLSSDEDDADKPQPGDFDYVETEDATPAILPCAHVACTGCMTSWLAAHDGCPFCREEHRHARCGHSVRARPLTQATIASLPATKPEGGRVAADCAPCAVQTRQRRARAKMAGLAEGYVAARRALEQRPDSGEARRALRKAQRAFERCGLDVGYEEVMAEHTAW
ncbi:uncharacterized protein PG998_011685 [Apiospora kogelbergensis]|uniref:uncharacterized protein n=1 Tax=Apiospora kogelbergensis TaxID=1337665 RepID=UPI00312DD94D